MQVVCVTVYKLPLRLSRSGRMAQPVGRMAQLGSMDLTKLLGVYAPHCSSVSASTPAYQGSHLVWATQMHLLASQQHLPLETT